MDVTAIAAGRLMSCATSVVVVALLPSEEWSTVTIRDLPTPKCAVQQCSGWFLCGKRVRGAVSGSIGTAQVDSMWWRVKDVHVKVW